MGKRYKGTPSAVFLPANQYTLEDNSELLIITVPIKGTYPTDEEDFPYRGEFNLSPEPGVILFGDLLKVMFAERVYPQLKDNQRFVISATEVNDTNVNIFGRIVEMVEEE